MDRRTNKAVHNSTSKNKISPIATNIRLSSYRLSKYIKASGKADYDKKLKQWKVRLKPFERLV